MIISRKPQPKGEDVELPESSHQVKEHSLLLVFRMIGILSFFFVMQVTVTLLILMPSAIPVDLPISDSALLIIVIVAELAMGILEAVMLLFVTLHWLTTNYYITREHVIRYAGIMSVDEHIFELSHLRSVELHQSWFGRLCHYGNITLRFAVSGYHEDLTMREIAYPKLYERALKKHIREKKPANAF